MKEIKLHFTKMTGAGNDFILVDNRAGDYTIDWKQLSPKICDRRFGVGADGLLIVENSIIADFKMLYYNSDGSYGGMCGNGGRCISLYMMRLNNKQQVNFEALDFIYSAEVSNVNIKLKMKSPIILNMKVLIDLNHESIELFVIDTGAPHAVIFLDNISQSLKFQIDTEGIKRIGSLIRYHKVFGPTGLNVNFVKVNEDKSISLRTYERGVEDETLACGTGSIASAIAACVIKKFVPPVTIHTRSGEIMIVNFKMDGKMFPDVELIGPAKEVFAGTYRYLYT